MNFMIYVKDDVSTIEIKMDEKLSEVLIYNNDVCDFDLRGRDLPLSTITALITMRCKSNALVDKVKACLMSIVDVDVDVKNGEITTVV